jgi:NAD(P)-dependent dehydrogenase (short-subunit alcohol dehydrogenase family)
MLKLLHREFDVHIHYTFFNITSIIVS